MTTEELFPNWAGARVVLERFCADAELTVNFDDRRTRAATLSVSSVFNCEGAPLKNMPVDDMEKVNDLFLSVMDRYSPALEKALSQTTKIPETEEGLGMLMGFVRDQENELISMGEPDIKNALREAFGLQRRWQ